MRGSEEGDHKLPLTLVMSMISSRGLRRKIQSVSITPCRPHKMS